MPTYQYRCRSCSAEFEKVQSFSDDSTPKCPSCGTRSKKNVTKVFSAVGISFKGDGFYKTDSRSSKESGGTAAGSKADKGDAAGAKKGSSGSASPGAGTPGVVTGDTSHGPSVPGASVPGASPGGATGLRSIFGASVPPSAGVSAGAAPAPPAVDVFVAGFLLTSGAMRTCWKPFRSRLARSRSAIEPSAWP